MTLTASQALITVLAVALGCMITRFAPFVIFPDSKEPPEVVTWLGKVLPAAMMGLLVVYSLKGVSLVSPPHGIPEFLAILVIVLLHRWKHNTFNGRRYHYWHSRYHRCERKLSNLQEIACIRKEKICF